MFGIVPVTIFYRDIKSLTIEKMSNIFENVQN